MTEPGPKMQCPECHTVLQSKSRHHFVRCSCPNQAFVDGGSAYLRMGWIKTPPVPYKPTKKKASKP